MIKIDEAYSVYRDDTDPGYPGGKAVPVSAGNKTDGTPWRALWFNTILGFFEAIIVEAWGQFIVDGEPDKVGQSDLLIAIKKIMVDTVKEDIDYLQEIVKNLVEEAPNDGRLYGRKSKTWMEITGGGGGTVAGDAIEALKFYSKKSLMITNSRIVDRRKRGWDIGLPYLSASSDVYHFDTDFFNPNQQSNITINYSGDAPVLVGKDDYNGTIYFNPAVQEVAPYEMIGRSLYGYFSVVAQVSGDNSTVEFWVRLFQSQNVVILRLGSDVDEIALHIGGADPEYSIADDDDIPYSAAEPEDIPYSAAGIYGNRAEHTWQGGSESVSLDDEGVEIEEGVWIHIAAVTTTETMSLFIGDKEIAFEKNSQTTQAMTLEINEDEDKFNVDELTLDQTVALDLNAFSENTANRIPYAALNYQQKWFVLEAQDVNYVKTNLFDTDQFKAAVRAVINT